MRSQILIAWLDVASQFYKDILFVKRDQKYEFGKKKSRNQKGKTIGEKWSQI